MKRWAPKHVVVVRSAAERTYAAEIVARCEAAGVSDIGFLRSDRITGLRGGDEPATCIRAKPTLAVVVEGGSSS
ncbi:hypothetical protein [Amycolatopsis sp. CA-128772]|uniref:hypothetical protein n=1 Tax=Amycolatopsis sp. CA-128772 TaxID=2073159 RepID=UPI000CD22CC0|nr:hypothetical protein [Amycolatopsis sp. CA-128772]